MKKIVIAIFFVLFNIFKIKAQIIFFPSDSTAFRCEECDSVFIFADNFAVTAIGNGVDRLGYENKQIKGENVPPSLKVRNPVGAILYNPQKSRKKIPVILGRRDAVLSLDQLLRHHLIGLNSFQGCSTQGNVKINVWKQSNKQNDFMVFLCNGRILASELPRNISYLPRNIELFTIQTFSACIDLIVGIWIAPPLTGNNFLSDKILSCLQDGPLLVEFWDGLGWEMFEKAHLSGLIKTRAENIQMAYAMYPPETKTNYAAMITGGLPEIDAEQNLFTTLQSVGIDYAVFEGERLSFPIPGNVKLHTATTPEKKDENIFQNVRAVIERDSIPLLFVHYHGLDDLSHANGPDAQRTINHLKQMWKWHNQLRKSWYGTMLIIADHGSHAIENDNRINNKFRDKGTKGTHGDFRFSDMAVPAILNKGDHLQNPHEIMLSAIKTARNRLFSQSHSTNDRQPDYAEITLVFGDSIISINASTDFQRFDQTFLYQYMKKGINLKGEVRGRLLRQLIPANRREEVEQLIVHAFDGNQVAFSAHDLKNNSLVLALEVNTDYSFSLYPITDPYPNRVVKWVRRIEFLK